MRAIGLPELILITMVAGALLLVPAIFYLMTLQRALERCAPELRAMPPGQVWLCLIPLFGLVWHFVVVLRLARSLADEYARQGVPLPEPELGKTLGLVACGLAVASFLPLLGILTGLAGMVCWILYWVRISDYSRRLAGPAFAIPAVRP